MLARAALTALLLIGCTQPTQTTPERSEAVDQPTAEQPNAEQPTAEQPSDRALQERCQSAVGHMTALVMGFGGAPPSEQEAAVIRATEQMSVATCVKEGLSEAQARCVLETTDAMRMGELRECPAIRDKQPSWLLLPPPRATERATERRSGDPAAGAAEEGGEEPAASAPQ